MVGEKEMAKRRGLAFQIVTAIALLIVLGIVLVILDTGFGMFINYIQINFGPYINPDLLNTATSEPTLIAIAVVISLIAYIILAGMRRNPGEEYT